MSEGFSLNVNGITNNPAVRSEPIRVDEDMDIYDLRRQIEARQVVKDYIRTEILRLQELLNTMTVEITSLDLTLRDRKPKGEPNNKRYLYAPGTEHQLGIGEGGAIEGEIVK